MVQRLVFWLVLVPLAVVILMFAVANREIVTVSFDPFSVTQPAASVSLPLFALIFVLVLLGVLLGGAAAWLRQSGYRRDARQRDRDVAALRREVEALNARLRDNGSLAAREGAARLAYRPRQD